MNYNEIKYAKNFIQQVICRIDFLEFLPNDIITNPNIIVSVRKAFPIPRMQQVFMSNTIIAESTTPTTPPSVSAQSKEGIHQEFQTSDSKNKLSLSNQYLTIELTKYSTFEEMYAMFDEVIKELFNKVKLTISRTGLRYVNVFSQGEHSIKKKHLAKGIAHSLDASTVKCYGEIEPIRSLSLSEYRVGNMGVNFRYGLFNKNYPNPAKGIDFVLDYDCFTLDPIQNYTDVTKTISEAHSNIQALFENSISDTLREVLNSD